MSRPRLHAGAFASRIGKSNRGGMKIQAHAESHVVELDDGSQWQIFPGDLATTLGWKPETDLHLEANRDRVSSHVLVNGADRAACG